MNQASTARDAPTEARPLDVALIGNCRVAALIDSAGRIVWWCFPRFDSNPVFCRLLAGDEEKGFCDVVVADLASVTSRYVRNTAIVETDFEDRHGGRVRVIDFAPRFPRFERMFRPPQLVRRIVPLAGRPRIAIRVRPCRDYGRPISEMSIGSNHIRYQGAEPTLRLTTDAPLSYVVEETTFALARSLTLIFGTDEPFEGAVDATAKEFEERTRDYWYGWVRALGVPFEWQSAVIRAAVTLLLCGFEESGGIVAAQTTSIPEAPASGRNWDYRYCWLRDAYFVVEALNRLGTTEAMEDYINFVLTVVADPAAPLRPVDAIVPCGDLSETVASDLVGFLGQGPVRVGNAAASQDQHDVYGSVLLAAAQMFVDERLPRMGDVGLFEHLEPLGAQAAALALTPDAGIWEYRGRRHVNTYSAALCWAACDRLAQIAGRLGIADRADFWRREAAALREPILARAWNPALGAFTGALDGDELDASVLLLAKFGLVGAGDERFVSTCDVIGRRLKRHGLIMRYVDEDDFGTPVTAFLACSFWYIDALTAIGRAAEARLMFVELLGRRNAFGLLSEDVHPATGALWGNIPQTYSMAGIINSAMRLSVKWEDVWCRA